MDSPRGTTKDNADQLGNKPNAIAQLLLLSLHASKNYADDPLTPRRFESISTPDPFFLHREKYLKENGKIFKFHA